MQEQIRKTVNHGFFAAVLLKDRRVRSRFVSRPQISGGLHAVLLQGLPLPIDVHTPIGTSDMGVRMIRLTLLDEVGRTIVSCAAVLIELVCILAERRGAQTQL